MSKENWKSNNSESIDNKGVTDPVKETVTPAEPKELAPETVYHNDGQLAASDDRPRSDTRFFYDTVAQSDIEPIYDHLMELTRLLGIERKTDMPLESGICGLYVRDDDHGATLFTGLHLPGCTSGTGIEAELTLLARGIAFHMSSIEFDSGEAVQAAWTWDELRRAGRGRRYNCQVEESLNPCGQCRMKNLCMLNAAA